MRQARVHNHWLMWEGDDVAIQHKRERTGAPITPELIVIHYGVTHSLASLVAAQRSRGYWAHLSIDGYADPNGPNYQLFQALPFNERGSHAGKSSWNGRSSVNGFSIGIEIANPGPLKRKGVGFVDVYGRAWTGADPVEAKHKDGRCGYSYWAPYTDQEIDILVEVCGTLRETYQIQDIVGHDDISPGRKIDPGPAFDLEHLRKASA